jgi:Ca-activated chloride channel family protein
LKIKTIEAKGATPIARSLEASASDFPDTISRNIIILITDGLESCDNDPCVIAKKLKEKGVKVTPFVIGLGMDMSYLDKFNCIGSYTDAEDKESFRNVFKNILNTVLVKTTVQVNLNDINGKPTETNVTLFFYEAGTTKLKYTFVHTLNRLGNPDTLFLDPTLNYDLIVNTIPRISKSSISLKKYVHNTISVSAPQGMLKLTTPNSIYGPSVAMVISKVDDPKTIHHQLMGEINKYVVGTYDVEILTLPRIYKTADVTQSNTETILIDAPGQLDFTFEKPMIAQLFVNNNAKDLVWVYNFSDRTNTGQLLLQPGSYTIVYRNKEMKSSGYTREKSFTITSNKTNSIKLN